ncbi:hypothetical protein AK812_SmicGene15825 [Symbiodinium microadriaticum]|uniref:Uncharacterized protein n=1 Tax=Symbiodinium microadriaticum TaxID=2951 RepID=A0A1Q9E1Y6_SYMMI|nr:hypothetical protein AK812_SmicGene15825 [Symbiodinium microadriaticum]
MLPADPQPDLGFACVLAEPVWADYRVCLVDVRSIDGRLYAQQFSDQLSRSSILVQIGIRDAPGLRVLLAGVALAPVGLYDMPHGGSVVIVPPGVREEPRIPLHQLLQGLAEWDRHTPFLNRGISTEFLMLSDGLPRVLPVDLDGITNSARLKAAAAEAFRFDVDKITVCPAIPRIRDIAYLGRECQAVLAATESICRIPVPPGRLMVRQHMAFLDMRLLLADVSWLLAPHGVLEVARLERDILPRVPFGHSLSITGGRRESRGYREFIHVAHGELLSFCFVENRPSDASLPFDSPSGQPPSDQEDPPPEEDEEESDSAPSDSTRSSPARSQRSRSPKPCTGSVPPKSTTRAVSLSPSKFDVIYCLLPDSFVLEPPSDPGPRHIDVSVLDFLDCSVIRKPFVEEDPAFLDLGEIAGSCHRKHWSNLAPLLSSCIEELARGVLTSKTLDEPVSSSEALSHAVAFLRYAAPRLGPAWRYRPPAGAVHVVPDSGSEFDGDESEPETVTLHFILLKPGFVPEQVALDIMLPATLAEAFMQLQVQRCPDHAASFPLLVPARPQPVDGNGVVLALPAWCATELYVHRFLCFDLTLVDGRLFTAACPPYVSRRHLMHLAHLPREAPVQVYVGGDQVPLAHTGQHHVANGDTFVFVPRASASPALIPLEAMLASRLSWSTSLLLSSVADDNCYGLVCDSETVLFFSDFAHPMTYRTQIANCVGIAQHRLRLYPSSPRVPDATLQGQPCRTVLAICEAPAVPVPFSFGILLDARALLQGWYTFEAVEGRVSCIRIRVALQRDVPSGWRAGIRGVSTETDFLDVCPGQVLTAVAEAFQHGPTAAAVPDGGLGSDPPSSGTPMQEVDDQSSRGVEGCAGEPGYDPDSPAVSAPGQSDDLACAEDYRTCSFLILGQDYDVEHVEVRLALGVSVGDALRLVSSARSPQARAGLPLIQAVYPQPQLSHALCVATPEWEPAGALVAIDSRSINGRLFSVQLVGRVTRQGLFYAAGLDCDDSVQVYIGNQPWPLLDGPAVEFFPGELVLFQPAAAPPHTVATLQEMLSSATGWASAFDPSAFTAGGSLTWVLSDETATFFDVRADRRLQLRQDIASHVGVSSRELVLQAAHLDVQDFAHRGVCARAVLAALRHTEFLPSTQARAVVCFVDARPILGGLVWQVCPNGYLDYAAVVARSAHRCPAGYTTWLLKSGDLVQPAGPFLAVLGGEVFTVCFQYSPPVEEDISPPHDPPAGDGEDFTDSDDDMGDPPPGSGSHSVGSLSSLSRLADTGGTARSCRAPDAGPAHRSYAMWDASSFLAFVLVDTWRFTPSWSLACLFGVSPAVCGLSPGYACSSAVSADAISAWGSRLVSRFSLWDVGPSARKWSAGFLQYALLLGSLWITSVVASVFSPQCFIAFIWLCLLSGPLRLHRGRFRWFCLLLCMRAPAAVAMQLGASHVGSADSSCVLPDLARPPPAARSLPSSRAPRVLPTPCRARPMVRASATDLADPTLVLDEGTLLEQAVRTPGNQALFLAATLLDTIIEYFAEAGPDIPVSVSGVEVFDLDGCVGRSPAPDEILVLTSDGSFSDRLHVAGWSVTASLVAGSSLLLPGQFVGCFGGSMGDFLAVLPPDTPVLDPYLAETAGLLCAGIAAAQLPWHGTVLFRADNISALEGVQGLANMPSHPLCLLARDLHTALQVGYHCQPRYQHVPGHCGEEANELADALAAHYASASISGSPFSFDFSYWCAFQGLRSRWLPHVCMTLARSDEFPALREDVHSWARGAGVCEHPPAFAMAPFLRDLPVDRQEGVSRMVCFRLVTYNALSLLGDVSSSHPQAHGLHGAIGRVVLLSRALEAEQIAVAGVQECRTPKGSFSCGPYRRLASGPDDQACYGVELWLHKDSPIEASTAVVLHADPTCLIAGATFAGAPLRILVGHAPHRVHTEEVRRAWWARVCDLCRTLSGAAPWLLLMDANARVGSETSPCVGAWEADTQDLNGQLLHQLLSYLSSWLPATFRDCAFGDGHTLYQKRNGTLVRSDYVGVPNAWSTGNCQTWVSSSISAGHMCIDHFAAVAAVQLLVPDRRPKSKAARICKAALADPANADQIESIIQAAPRPAWRVDASEHAALIVDHLYLSLAHHFPATKRRLRASYLSADTATLHQAVAGLRHRIRADKIALRLAYLRCVILSWRSSSVGFCELFAGPWLWHLRIHYGACCLLLRRFGSQLRRQYRTDRAAYFDSLASAVATSSPQELHQQVRRVLKPKRYRRPGADPLPMLVKEDGSVCQSYEESLDTWRSHFAALEDGIAADADTLVRTCRARQDAFVGTDLIAIDDVPSYAQFERSIRASAPGKAAGPDLLPPTLLRCFSSSIADLLWPLMLKVIFQAAEPAGLKGGTLFCIPKPNVGAQNTCSGYRGILVQSGIAKAIHRSARPLAVGHWLPRARACQLGGRKGCSADMGHFLSRGFLHYSQMQGLSCAILFLDLTSAYYGIIRETVLGAGLSDRSIEEMASSLSLTPEDLQLLRHYVSCEPVLASQDASTLLAELSREMHASTWFVLSQDRQLVHTHRGTRPGGALADIVFNVLFAKVLERRDPSVLSAVTPVIPWDGQFSPFAPAADPKSHGGQPQTLGEVVYADDLASFTVSRTAEGLRSALGGAAAATLDVLGPHGLRPNYGPKKTAAIVAVAGRGSRKVRRTLFGDLRGKLPVFLEHSGVARIDLVTSYKHLGSHLSYDGHMLVEIRYRLALGRAAFKEGRQRLFACRHIPVDRRALLFRTYVLSTVLSGAGTWPWLSATEWQAFSGGIVSLYRQLLCLKADGGYEVTTAQILARCGLPSPASLLAAARLRFLGQLVRQGPDPAWAILRWYTPFQRAVRSACSWLLQAVSGTSSLGDPLSDWETWRSLIVDCPGQWKGLLKRAEAWHSEVDVMLASLDSSARRLWSPCPAAPCARGLSDCEHACLPCVAQPAGSLWPILPAFASISRPPLCVFKLHKGS